VQQAKKSKLLFFSIYKNLPCFVCSGQLFPMDTLLTIVDRALRTVFTHHRASRANPAGGISDASLSDAEKRNASALMRVNHVGEICAQALYTAQALATKDEALRRHFHAAYEEETDHLAWTEERLKQLGGRTSVLNPIWYAGAFGIGFVAAKLGGDLMSLGFVVETERQVEAHLQSHMQLLPVNDQCSRSIVTQMKTDEMRHAQEALAAGAVELPEPIKGFMRAAAKVMTTVAYRL